MNVVPDSSFYAYSGFTRDVKSILSDLRVPHKDSSQSQDWSIVYNNNWKPVVRSTQVSRKSMPDVKNMTLKDALYLLENMDMNVLVRGKGKVVAQDVAPGAAISKNQTVTLLLN